MLIDLVEAHLPQGYKAWKLVAALYQSRSKEFDTCDAAVIRDHWVKKLCNNFKKPTGMTGEAGDRVCRCIEIEWSIQRKASAGILGIDSAKSSHGSDDGSRYSDEVASVQNEFRPTNINNKRNENGNIL